MDEASLKKLFGWYLTCSYAYYKMDISIIPDEQFDKLCRVLSLHYGTIKHRYWALVQKDDFDAGTGYAIRATVNITCRAW